MAEEIVRGTTVPRLYELNTTLGAPGSQALVQAEIVHALTGTTLARTMTVLENVDGQGNTINRGQVTGVLAGDASMEPGVWRLRFHVVYPDGSDDYFPTGRAMSLIVTPEPVTPAPVPLTVGKSLVLPYHVNVLPPVMPVISRGLPFFASSAGGFGGANAEANAIDADYGTFWRSIFEASIGTPQWYALDISSVPAAQRASVWAYWKNLTQLYQPTQQLGHVVGSAFTSEPRNYRIQGHAAAGGGAPPAVGDVGWTDVNEVRFDNSVGPVNIADNYYSQRIHKGLDLRAYNWLRIFVTDTNGSTGATADVQLEIDLRNVAGGSDDSFLFYGDSIAMEAFRGRRVDNQSWGVGPIDNLMQTALARHAPVIIDGGVPGWTAIDGDGAKANIIGRFPCHWVALCFGANDANNANIDLNTLGGVNSAYAQAYKAAMQSMIDYAVARGAKCIIPTISWGDLSAWSTPNVVILNAIIGQLVAANPNNVIAGPDVYTLFQQNQNLIRDHLHPTWDNAAPGGLLNGMTGYENLLVLWRDRLLATVYG